MHLREDMRPITVKADFAMTLLDPFAAITKSSGTMASANTFRFSTKPFEPQVGIGWWGHRWLQPQHARWLSRDPIGERGGINVYAFVRNNALNKCDVLGLADISYGRRTTREQADSISHTDFLAESGLICACTDCRPPCRFLRCRILCKAVVNILPDKDLAAYVPRMHTSVEAAYESAWAWEMTHVQAGFQFCDQFKAREIEGPGYETCMMEEACLTRSQVLRQEFRDRLSDWQWRRRRDDIAGRLPPLPK